MSILIISDIRLKNLENTRKIPEIRPRIPGIRCKPQKRRPLVCVSVHDYNGDIVSVLLSQIHRMYAKFRLPLGPFPHHFRRVFIHHALEML